MRTPNSIARAAAKAAGDMFYTGDVCKLHPQLSGQRRSANGNCPECIRERMSKVSKKKAAKRHRAWRERVKAGHVPRKYRSAKEKAASAGIR